MSINVGYRVFQPEAYPQLKVFGGIVAEILLVSEYAYSVFNCVGVVFVIKLRYLFNVDNFSEQRIFLLADISVERNDAGIGPDEVLSEFSASSGSAAG